MNITKRQALLQDFLHGMIKGAGGQENFDLVLFLFDADPSYAEEVGKRLFDEVHAMEKEAITEDEKFELEMNEIAQARGYPSHNNQKGILVTLE